MKTRFLFLPFLLSAALALGAPKLVEDPKFTGAPDFSGITNKATVRSQLGGVLATKSVFVDAANGSDSTGTRERIDLSFATLGAAKTAALAGDTIFVRPGTYTDRNLLKNGVNWHFAAGSTIAPSAARAGYDIFDDTDGAVTCRITGALEIVTGTGSSGGAFNLSNASTFLIVEMFRISGTAAGANHLAGVVMSNGSMVLRLSEINQTGGNLTWWSNGNLLIQAQRMVLSGSSGSVAWAECVASVTPTGDFWVDCPEIVYSGGAGIYVYADADSAYRVWVKTSQIKSLNGVTFNAVLTYNVKCYVIAEKIIGKISSGGTTVSGELYLNTQKQNGAIIVGAATLCVLDIQFFDDTGIAGGTHTITMNAAGNLLLRGGRYKRTSAGHGINQSAGTIEVSGNARFDTSTSSSSNPINKTGGTLTLGAGTQLIAESTRDSISATTAQNVKIYPTVVANKAVNSNITLQVGTVANGGFIVDTNVQ